MLMLDEDLSMTNLTSSVTLLIVLSSDMNLTTASLTPAVKLFNSTIA